MTDKTIKKLAKRLKEYSKKLKEASAIPHMIDLLPDINKALSEVMDDLTTVQNSIVLIISENNALTEAAESEKGEANFLEATNRNILFEETSPVRVLSKHCSRRIFEIAGKTVVGDTDGESLQVFDTDYGVADGVYNGSHITRNVVINTPNYRFTLKIWVATEDLLDNITIVRRPLHNEDAVTLEPINNRTVDSGVLRAMLAELSNRVKTLRA